MLNNKKIILKIIQKTKAINFINYLVNILKFKKKNIFFLKIIKSIKTKKIIIKILKLNILFNIIIVLI
jgi:hypothetical protein